MISFVMDDESHMIFNLNISSVNSKALFNKNDNISDSFAKGLGKYFDAKNINADFYVNVDFNELFLDYSFDNDIDAECLVSFNTHCSEISIVFNFGNYRDESEEITEQNIQIRYLFYHILYFIFLSVFYTNSQLKFLL